MKTLFENKLIGITNRMKTIRNFFLISNCLSLKLFCDVNVTVVPAYRIIKLISILYVC